MFSLQRLVQVLSTLDPTHTNVFPNLADAIHLIYETTPDSSIREDPARKLLSQFVALRYTALSGEHFDALVAKGGQFMVDVSRKLVRKLMVNPLEEEFVELHRKCEILQAELKNKTKILNDEIRSWERWNNSRPSSQRRPQQNYDLSFFSARVPSP
jgi:hypothetical protein